MKARALADKASLFHTQRALLDDLRSAGVAQADAIDCIVAVTQACSNALQQRSPERVRPPLVSWRVSGAEARVTVEDGPPPQDVAELHALMYMRRRMDVVEIAEGRTRMLVLSKRFRPSAGSRRAPNRYP